MASARDALWQSGYDESVEVNQRALIDKVLARYSGEFTVFRELLQNSDDASATAVEIHFQTKGYLDRKDSNASGDVVLLSQETDLPDLKTTMVHQWTFKNNGILFRDEDWSRLKKIAEGNPDEEKIGAFGVGFYSLFSVTDEPWVFSGGQWMNFYWKDKKDQLFARRGARADAGHDSWTTFQMELREHAPIPPPFDFTRFLASSITFMRHLLDVSVYLDDKRLSRLSKTPGPSKTLSLPNGLKASSPLNMMVVNGIQTTPLSIKAEVMQWVYTAGTEKPQSKIELAKPVTGGGGFFSSLFSRAGSGAPSRSVTPMPAPSPPKEDPTTIVNSHVVLSIFVADVRVNLDKKMVAELNRSTKKNPPTRMKYELIYTGKNEYDASKREDEKQGRVTGSVFQGMRADIERAGTAKVFIGHSTAQTTGLGGHMSARFIPTVERESIDLVDRNVAVWNKELLYVGGLLARAVYELELGHIKELWDAALQTARIKGPGQTVDPELQDMLRGRAIHVLKFFTFYPSTPSAVVSAAQEEAFFACAINTSLFSLRPKSPFLILSTVGVRDASQVRYPDAAFSGFIKDLAVVPDEILKEARIMMDNLQTRGMINKITFVDVLEELRNRPLTVAEMIACFKWWIEVCTQDSITNIDYVRAQLLTAALLSIEEKDHIVAQVIPLSVIETYINSRSTGALIPTDGPLPPYLLPVTISRQFVPQSLMKAFGWRELSVVEWLQYIVSPPVPHDPEFDVHLSAPWAERVLQVLVRASQSLRKDSHDEIATILRDHACIPTSSGLKKAEEAYFQNAHIFHDLPVVTLPSGTAVKGPMEKLLLEIGVRKHVDLQIVFTRMIRTGDWTIAELVKYLVAVQSTLSSNELERLQVTAVFSKGRGEGETLPENGKLPRYTAADLYEPLDVFRELKLPMIDWGTHPKWRGSSEEAKFLFKLGLRRYPPLPELIGLAASNDVNVRIAALKYFFENYSTRYTDYEPDEFSNVAFIPAVKGSTRILAKPHEVFSSPEWEALGFMVVDSVVLKGDTLMHLKIQEHPSGARLLALLTSSPPPSEDIARQWFTTLANRMTAFSSTELKTLSDTPFVPVKSASGNPRYMCPAQCYFKTGSQAPGPSKLFTFVDFGAKANTFLSACGVKHEPSVEEIAKILVENPRQFYDLAEGRDNYMKELRNISVNRRLISDYTIYRLKKSAVLLGSRRVKKERPVKLDHTSLDLEEEEWEYQYDLLTPDRVVIADDTNAYQLFGDQIFTAPEEDLLEELYLELGCKRLSSLVRDGFHTNTEIVQNSRMAADTRSLILERLPLFLHEHTHTKTKIPYSWLNNDKNFVVKTFGKLTVTKTLHFAEKRVTKSQNASAVARRIGSGPIELWLAGNDQVDMYEVSTSMCRLLFNSPKINDALLFMTILSTDLRALRRRGYNVDRILRQQKADRLAAEEAARAKSMAALTTQSGSSSFSDALVTAPLRPSGQHVVPQLPEKEQVQVLEHNLPSLPNRSSKHGSRPMSTVLDFLNRNKRGDDVSSSNGSPPRERADSDSEAQPLIPTNKRGDDVSSSNGSPPRERADSEAQPLINPYVTPMSVIASNIELAITACKEERGEVLKNRQQMQVVKESLNEGYCGYIADLTFAGEMGGIKIYVAEDVPDARSFIRSKSESLARFIYTIRPLQELYTLPPTSLHIFHDRAGKTIAFNRNASLFLNLRYFEQWHDTEVQGGEMMNAYTSWYHTLAHEIAHNLVPAHNSEHEFYFSAICEAYLPAFIKLVTK